MTADPEFAVGSNQTDEFGIVDKREFGVNLEDNSTDGRTEKVKGAIKVMHKLAFWLLRVNFLIHAEIASSVRHKFIICSLDPRLLLNI